MLRSVGPLLRVRYCPSRGRTDGSTFYCESDATIGLHCRGRVGGWHESVVDFRPDIAKGEALSHLQEPAVFLHRLFVQSEGQSLAWETPAGLIDFHVDELWQRTHPKSFAAE